MLERGELRRAADAIQADFSALDVDESHHCLRTTRADLLAWRRNRPPWQRYHRPVASSHSGPLTVLVRGVDVEEDALLAASERLRELVEADRLAEARKYVVSLSSDETRDPRIQAWLDVLALPKGVPSESLDTNRTADYAFLERESVHHRGRWVAVAEGALVASTKSYEEPSTVELRGDVQGGGGPRFAVAGSIRPTPTRAPRRGEGRPGETADPFAHFGVVSEDHIRLRASSFDAILRR